MHNRVKANVLKATKLLLGEGELSTFHPRFHSSFPLYPFIDLELLSVCRAPVYLPTLTVL